MLLVLRRLFLGRNLSFFRVVAGIEYAGSAIEFIVMVC